MVCSHPSRRLSSNHLNISMPSSPPAEAQHFRGNTLTPESPRPLHVPEPSNIPVLEKQIDPVFNLMSTHMDHPHALRDLTAMDHEMMSNKSSAHRNTSHVTEEEGDGLRYDPKADDFYGESRSSDGDPMSWNMSNVKAEAYQSDSSLIQNHTSLQADQPSTSIASNETIPTTTETNSNLVPSSLPFSQDTSQHPSDSYEPFQKPPTTNGQTIVPTDHERDEKMDIRGADDEDIANGGVNYQTLLDSISPSSVPASQLRDISITSPDSSADTNEIPVPSSANLPATNLPAPAGLPPRPPPQEKPAIHPNYMPGEDIRSYHYPHVHHAGNNPNHPSQPSNSYRPSQNLAPSQGASGAPGTSSAQNGLPPPPMATFQQPPRTNEPAQPSPTTQQIQQKDTNGTNSAKASIPGSASDRGTNWGNDIERIYDQFVNDERVYTAEGTWDKFPPGSRLFVGMHSTRVPSL